MITKESKRKFFLPALLTLLLSIVISALAFSLETDKDNSLFLTVCDINGDGKDELLFTANSSAPSSKGAYIDTLYCYGGDGRLIFKRAMAPSPEPFYASVPTIADLSCDGIMEIAYRYRNAVYLMDKNGNDFSKAWPKELDMGNPVITSNEDCVAVGDFNGNGNLEIVAVQNEGYAANIENEHLNIYIFNSDGTCVAGWPVTIKDCSAVSNIRCGDINGDGYDELILVTVSEDTNGARSKAIYFFSHDGIELMKKDVGSITGAILADLDNDGSCEFIYGNEKGIDVICKDGHSLKGWPFISLDQTTIPRLAVDINCDGKVEIITECIQYPETTEAAAKKLLLVLNSSGQIDTSSVFNQLTLPSSAAGVYYADMDNDGMGEIIVKGQCPSSVINSGVKQLYSESKSYLSVYRTGAKFNSSLAQWPAPHHDKYNTNRWTKNSPRDDVISIELNGPGWAMSDVKPGEKRNNLANSGLPAHVVKNTGKVPVRIGIRYASTASNITMLPGTEQGKNKFVTMVNNLVVPERGEVILSDPIKPGTSAPLYLTYGAPTSLSERVSNMSVAYEIRAYKSSE